MVMRYFNRKQVFHANRRARNGHPDACAVPGCRRLSLQIRAGLLLMLLYAVGVPADDSTTNPATFTGTWILNEKLSDEPSSKLKGRMRQQQAKQRQDAAERRQQGNPLDGTQHDYWDKIEEMQTRRAAERPADAGNAGTIVAAKRLEIGGGGTELQIVYDGRYHRLVRPQTRRVYTASGKELVSDTIGATLAYWDGTTLVLETELKPAGTLVERLNRDADRLTLELKLQNPLWDRSARINRVFDKQP